MRILIVEDDADFCHLFASFLESEGFEVQTAATGAEGLQVLGEYHPALLILDVKLPDIDGPELCESIRRVSDLPILMVSGCATGPANMAYGLECGADAYLEKPVALDLLKAYVLALLRRQMDSRGFDREVYIDSHVTVNFRNRQVRIMGQPVSLAPTEFQLLELLALNPDQIVPTLEIAETLWPGVNENSAVGYVYTYIKRLRKSIEPDPQNPTYILNEYGLGYCFVPRRAVSYRMYPDSSATLLSGAEAMARG